MTTLDAKQAGLPNDGSAVSPAAVAAFNRQLRQQSAPVVNFPPGLYALPQSLAVPNGVTFTGGGTLQALAPSTPLFAGDAVSGATWQGLTLLGLGTDYSNRPSGGPTNACGIKLTGQGGTNATIRVDDLVTISFAVHFFRPLHFFLGWAIYASIFVINFISEHFTFPDPLGHYLNLTNQIIN